MMKKKTTRLTLPQEATKEPNKGIKKKKTKNTHQYEQKVPISHLFRDHQQ
jgi:hypothetical protein